MKAGANLTSKSSTNRATIEDIIVNTRITILVGSPAVQIVAETPRLRLTTFELADVAFYQNMFSNPIVMEKFAAGVPLLYKDEESKKAGKIDYVQHHFVDKPDSYHQRWSGIHSVV